MSSRPWSCFKSNFWTIFCCSLAAETYLQAIMYLWRSAMSSWVVLQRLSRTCFVFPVMSCCSCKVYQIKMQPGEAWIVSCTNLIALQLLWKSLRLSLFASSHFFHAAIPGGRLMWTFSLNTEKLGILNDPVPISQIWLPPSNIKQCFIYPVFQKPTKLLLHLVS